MARFIVRWRPLLLVVLAVAVGATFAVSRTGTATAASAPRLTATEIADGVLFNDGRAATYLTALRRGPTAWTDDLRGTQSRIHRSIAADPRWADGFTTRMQSGDPRQIAQGMSDLGVVARRVLDEQYGRDKVDKAVLQIDQDWVEERLIKEAMLDAEFSFDLGGGTWLETDSVVALWEVAVVAIAVVLAVVAIDFTPKTFSERANLAHEVLVEEIAAGLQTGL